MKTITAGQKLAIQFRPFLSPGVQKESDVDPTIEAMGRAIDNRYKRAIEVLEELQSLGIQAEIKTSVHRLNALVSHATLCLIDLKNELVKE